jgi:predicted dithiol-disulfide oxidoreductase (DUF899 family)
LPWEKVEKKYVFEKRNGKETLADLFQGRSQLIIYHFMFGPGWKEGCAGCSFHADHMDGAIQHLEHHDVSYVVVSRAPNENGPNYSLADWVRHHDRYDRDGFVQSTRSIRGS